MDPRELAGKGNGDPMSFVKDAEEVYGNPPKFVSPSMPSARKVMAEYFSSVSRYQEWLEKNPYIEVIAVNDYRDYIVLTYKEPF
jgi:hypothetical protein